MVQKEAKRRRDLAYQATKSGRESLCHNPTHSTSSASKRSQREGVSRKAR